MPVTRNRPIQVQFTAIGSPIRPFVGFELAGTLNATMAEFCDDVITELKVYPPPVPNPAAQRAGSTAAAFWPRSGNLRASWERVSFSSGPRSGFRIVNHAREGDRGEARVGRTNRLYADWVQGPRQAYFHRNHQWLTVKNAIALVNAKRGFAKGLQNDINKFLKTQGLIL